MWLFTTLGFFSIVRKPHEAAPGRPVQIRARKLSDLRDLIREAGISGKSAEVIVTPNADYCGRIAVTESELAAIMVKLGNDIDYGNFKNAVALTPNQRDKKGVLSEIWEIMWNYQAVDESNRRERSKELTNLAKRWADERNAKTAEHFRNVR